jgi:hypothetical protein
MALNPLKTLEVENEMAIPAGLEPATRGVEIRYSIQLSYGTDLGNQPGGWPGDVVAAFIALPI